MVVPVLSTQINSTSEMSQLYNSHIIYTGWVKLNGAMAVSFVVVKHVLEN